VETSIVVECLGTVVDCMRPLREHNDFMPEGGYQVMNDIVDFPGPAEDPFNTPALGAYNLAAVQLGAAEDHIYALQTLWWDARKGPRS
jgi:hypothetical protein